MVIERLEHVLAPQNRLGACCIVLLLGGAEILGEPDSLNSVTH